MNQTKQMLEPKLPESDGGQMVPVFVISLFGFGVCFGFRISDFGFIA
jgi:hypothetical protein